MSQVARFSTVLGRDPSRPWFLALETFPAGIALRSCRRSLPQAAKSVEWKLISARQAEACATAADQSGVKVILARFLEEGIPGSGPLAAISHQI
jgi:hypothetical protein